MDAGSSLPLYDEVKSFEVAFDTCRPEMQSSKKQCGCKGIRSCLLCEKNKQDGANSVKENAKIYSYCVQCKTARQEPVYSQHPHSDTDVEILHFPGILIIEDFVSEPEEQELCSNIYKTPFVKSQSGRYKQDYGPKVNFKKQKVKTEIFTGLPHFSRFLYERMKTRPELQDFIPIELCNLEYTPERGSAIDPHFDDFWLWGERLVTLNLLSNTTLFFTKDDESDLEVHVPLLRRSLIVVYGPARIKWKHGIHRHDVTERRIAMTFRELSHEFCKGGKSEMIGQNLIDVALTFEGTAVGSTSVEM